MIGGYVVTQYGQGTHAFHGAVPCQSTLPIGRTTDIGTHFLPVIEWTFGLFRLFLIEQRSIDCVELLGLNTALNDGIDFFVLWPEINQADIIAILVLPQDILLNIKTYGSSNGIGYNQWR